MTIYAYLRVSTDKQDVANQRHGILEYANQRGLTNLLFIEDAVSGKKNWRERRLGEILNNAEASDVILFAEVSRMARSTLQVLEILEYCVEKKIKVHIAKQQMVFDDSLNSRITATVLGLAAEIEREFISLRTKEALAKRKSEGLPLGRPRGRAAHVKLDDRQEEIRGYLKKGISKRAIAKLVDCAPSTLYDWIKRDKERKKTG